MALLTVTSVAFVGVGAVAAQESNATASISEQTSGGHTVVVDEVTVPDGGFVTIHDSTVLDGGEATFESVRGTSEYLEPGTHENVTVKLDEPLAEDGTAVAMAHQDTDDDRIYRFVSSGGEADGPYTADGEAVVDTANVTVSATVGIGDQPTDGASVLVDRVELSEGGFVTIHDSSLQDGETFESVRGTSEYLGAGVHEDVRIELDSELEGEDTLIPMAHRDTNDNQEYDFVDSEGDEDGPFLTNEDGAVIDAATVTPSTDTNVTMSNAPTSGYYVTVDEVFVEEGGFVTIHDSSVQDGEVFESIRGSSDYLEPGLHRDVGVHLDEPLEEDDTVVPMAHRDTDGDEEYTFEESEGEEDGPYTSDGDPVVDTANVNISADVGMDDRQSNGNTVVVDQVDLSEGGFVTVHDASLFAGETLGSVRGTSEYLEAGHHHNVTVTLEEPLTESQTVVPMAHRDTNDNEQYDFVDDEGSADGPYTYDGEAVVDTARASVLAQVTFSDQEDVGDTVTVDSVTLHDGGFVTIHDSTVLDGDVFDSVRGTSEYLGPGTHEDVEVQVDEVPGGDDTLVAMPHHDTNGNQQYDFVEQEGSADGPYTARGEAVVDDAQVTGDDSGGEPTETDGTATETGTETQANGTDMQDDGDDEATQDDGAGFGAVVALLAIVGALLVARRQH